MVASALFGALGADDPVPAYRLSASSRLPRLAALGALWRPILPPALSYDGLVVDLRSSGYLALAPVPGAVVVRVLTEASDGTRSVVSHANKSTKGLLARALLTSRAAVDDQRTLLTTLRRSGFAAEQHDARTIDVIVR